MDNSVSPVRKVYDAGQKRELPGTLVYSEGDGPSEDAAVSRVVDGLGATFDLFWSVYGRNSLDGEGLPLVATVHYGKDFGNSFWGDGQLVFGDGDGKLFLDFTRSLENIAHQLTMGLIEHTANLLFHGETGALAVSIGDVFGSLVKQRSLGQTAEGADWLIGVDMAGPEFGGGAMRSLKAPGTAYKSPRIGEDPQVATMGDYVETNQDNGGVHINSGIPAHAFYLVATTLGGHAWERAGQIWYDVLTGGELESNAEFADFARLTVAAAGARYGADSKERKAVLDAWSKVGVKMS